MTSSSVLPSDHEPIHTGACMPIHTGAYLTFYLSSNLDPRVKRWESRFAFPYDLLIISFAIWYDVFFQMSFIISFFEGTPSKFPLVVCTKKSLRHYYLDEDELRSHRVLRLPIAGRTGLVCNCLATQRTELLDLLCFFGHHCQEK